MTIESLLEEKKASTYQTISRADQVQALEEVGKKGKSQTEVAENAGIPRTTLNYWCTRRSRTKEEIDPAIVEFYESPAGLIHLHQILTAALFVFNKMGESGLPSLQKFLKLSNLNSFTASSIGTLHKLSSEMDGNILDFGDIETTRLSALMTDRKIGIALDETFFPDRMILVMMEPVSNYILAEEESEKRDAAAWDEVSKKALSGLKVQVIQATADEGSGLTSFVLNLLGAHKNPDLFHVQQDVSKAMGGHIGRQIKAAEKSLKKSNATAERARHNANLELQKAEVNFSFPSKRLTKLLDKIETADNEKEQAQRKLKVLEENKLTMREEKKRINNSCHPYDPGTGERRSPDDVKVQLNASYDQLEKVASAVDCTEKQKKRLQKSRKMVESLISSVAFFFLVLKGFCEDLQLSEKEQLIFEKYLVPIAYLQLAKSRSNDEKIKKTMQTTIERLESDLKARDGPWSHFCHERQALLLGKSIECASFYQRSSSCVEGRNGVLSLRHHAQRHLSAKRIKVLTVIHNYAIERPDSTTPAERFFGQKPKNLFEDLLDRTSWPIRPRKKAWTRKKTPINGSS